MKTISNLKREFSTARARWKATRHGLNHKPHFMGQTNSVRAGRALSQSVVDEIGLQTQRRGGGCDVSLQPGFLGTGDR
jgi:hypothetical protein